MMVDSLYPIAKYMNRHSDSHVFNQILTVLKQENQGTINTKNYSRTGTGFSIVAVLTYFATCQSNKWNVAI